MVLRIPLTVKDNAEGNLDAGISASETSIALESGDGANFPTTYHGNTDDVGTQTTLEATGIGASGIQVGDGVYNITDGSSAVVTAVNTDSLTTTKLRGGSDNTWQNGDEYTVNPFVVTLNARNASGVITKSEKVLIDYRTTDALYCRAANRGYDGTTGQTFSAGDYVSLFVEASLVQEINDGIAELLTEKADAEDVILKSVGTTAGDVMYYNGSSWVRLGVGTAGQVLKVNSGATAVEWGAQIADTSFDEADFSVYQTGDATAEVGIDASNISTGQKRNIIMPDENVDLAVALASGDIEIIDETDNVTGTGTKVHVFSHSLGRKPRGMIVQGLKNVIFLKENGGKIGYDPVGSADDYTIPGGTSIQTITSFTATTSQVNITWNSTSAGTVDGIFKGILIA
jgi:hypothetical protein